MFIDPTANTTAQPRRGGMFVDPMANTSSFYLGSVNMTSLRDWTRLLGIGSINMPPLTGLMPIPKPSATTQSLTLRQFRDGVD